MNEKTHTTPPGVYADLSNAEYHGGPGISKSGLDLINKTPATYRYVMDNPTEREETTAMRVGTAVHAAILEPELFATGYCRALRRQDAPDAIDDRDELVNRVAILNESRQAKLATGGSKAELVARISENVEGAPEADALEGMKAAELKALLAEENDKRPGLLSTSGSRHDLAALLAENGEPVTLWSDVKAQWEANNGHRVVLSEDEYAQVTAMRDTVMAHPSASKILNKEGVAERSVYWADEETGELCRCRPDWWVPSAGILADVKTTDDASPEGFGQSIKKWRYHVQHPMYLDGCNQAIAQAGLDWPEQRYFVFIVVEKKAPYNVGVYVLDDDSVAVGRAEYRANLHTYAECQAHDDWPAFSEKIETVSLPEWYIRRVLPSAAA